VAEVRAVCAEDATSVPHSWQNFAPGRSVAPQAIHFLSCRAPHSGQNFAPSGIETPQFQQSILFSDKVGRASPRLFY
jgi:hypothetical protein